MLISLSQSAADKRTMIKALKYTLLVNSSHLRKCSQTRRKFVTKAPKNKERLKMDKLIVNNIRILNNHANITMITKALFIINPLLFENSK